MSLPEFDDHERELALRFADVALPDYVTDSERWEWTDDAWRRLFTVKEWQVAAVRVAVAGEQCHTGGLSHWIYVGGEDQLARPDQRRLVDVLTDAGLLLEALD